MRLAPLPLVSPATRPVDGLRGPMVRGASRSAMPLALLVGAALRLYPIGCPYLGLELQNHYPANAIFAIGRGDWEPVLLHHGAGLLDLLRALYSVVYSVGHIAGTFADRIDLVAAYARNALPFIIMGRIVVCAFALATMVAVGRLARARDGGAAGAGAILILATSPIHVRESLHVWPDVLIGALALATTVAALRVIERGGLRAAAAMGALGGITLATKFSAVPVLLPIAVAILLRADERGRRIAATGLAGTTAFLLLSPYIVIKWHDTFAALSLQARIMSLPGGGGLSLPTLVGIGLGWGPVALAVAGIMIAASTRWRDTIVLAAFPLAYLVLLARSSTLYARYLTALAPFVALFASAGAARIGAWLVPRWPAVGAATLVLAAVAAPLVQSVHTVRLFAREDTRQQAGDWIVAHIPFGTPIALPDAVPYPNPILAPDSRRLQLDYPAFATALAARGFGDPARTYPASYLRFFDAPIPSAETLTPVVVAASHPVVVNGMNVAPGVLDSLRARGARPVATFSGIDDPLPPGVVFDPIDAEYVPLTGAELVQRPGPNITIWALPGSPLRVE